MNKKIVIIGAGAIGSRHLQGVKKITQFNYEIFVIDKNLESLNLAKKRYKEIKDNKKIKSVVFDSKINVLPKKIDLLINATTSSKRYSSTKSVIDICVIKNIIFEKVLFNSILEIKKMDAIIKKKKIKAWVNCSYQCIPYFKKIRSLCADNGKLTMNVHGGNWSLGSSCIHFIEFFNYLTNSEICKMNFDLLGENIQKSKRKRYYEFGGLLLAKTTSGDYLSIEAKKNSKKPLFIDISNNDIYLQLEDAKRLVKIKDYSGSKIKERRVKINMPMQSDSSKYLCENILIKKRCDLPTYKTSSKNHILLFKSLLKIKKLKNKFGNNKLLIS